MRIATDKSLSTGLRAMAGCIARPNTSWTVLSASKAQAVEFVETCQKNLQLMGATAQLYQDETFIDALGSIEAIQQRISFPNGSRIIALPANPRTARGYPGNAILDEFGHHEDSYAIWAAIVRQVALGHKLRASYPGSMFTGRSTKAAPSISMIRASASATTTPGIVKTPAADRVASLELLGGVARQSRPGRAWLITVLRAGRLKGEFSNHEEKHCGCCAAQLSATHRGWHCERTKDALRMSRGVRSATQRLA
ncbi:MAG: terminase family protein [Candidatus Korobacteraceae bacterium]